MSTSKIEWTDETWNPTTGCNMISAGCKYCYAAVLTERLKAMGQKKYQDGFAFRMHPDTLTLPYKWKKPRLVFVNSMSDLFHKEAHLSYIQQVFEVMNNTPQHTYQVLTKRSEILLQYDKMLTWTPNIWMGVSIENTRVLHRLEDLRKTSAHLKFLSCEPLLGPLPNLDLTAIDWLIAGGESGHKARPMEKAWVLDLLQQCQTAGTKFFFKQWGGTNKKEAGRLLQGRTWDEMPG